MKIFTLSILSLALASLSGGNPAHAEEALQDLGVTVLSADPTCDPAHSVTIHTAMEFQDGLWAWRPVGAWEICVNDGGTSEITVNFKDETYQAVITINGRHVDLAPPADQGWAFVFTRQDYLNKKISAPARETSFVLDPGHRRGFELGGYFYSQARNLRFKVSY